MIQKHQVYHHGIIEFVEIQAKKDKYNALIRGEFDEKTIYKDWYRKLGITAEDTYFANADNQSLTRKVAVRGDVEINVKWRAKIDGKQFTVYRVFYAYKRNETEISLVEVGV